MVTAKKRNTPVLAENYKVSRTGLKHFVITQILRDSEYNWSIELYTEDSQQRVVEVHLLCPFKAIIKMLTMTGGQERLIKFLEELNNEKESKKELIISVFDLTKEYLCVSNVAAYFLRVELNDSEGKVFGMMTGLLDSDPSTDDFPEYCFHNGQEF